MRGAPMVVLGPGTGLGIACLVPGGDAPIVIASEGGHATLPATSRREDAILAHARERFGHVSAERLISGPGLENLYAADVGSNLQFVVTAAATGSVITTSSAHDQVTLGAGADVVDTGAGIDFVFGELTAGDDIDLGDDDDTFQLTGPVADGAQVDGGESFLGDKLRILGGGDLTIEWNEANNHVYMTGPAVEVFTGDWPE